MRDAWWDLIHGGACCACGAPGRLLCRSCADGLPRGGRRVAPDPCPPGLAPCLVAGEYADPLRALILAHKERGAHALHRPLGDLLAGTLLAGVPSGSPLLLVPVPSRPAVVRARGHDPVLRIARRAASTLRRERPARVLRLLRSRLPVADQAGLDATARFANLRDSLAVRPSARDAWARTGLPVVLCDDVLTTGATVAEAQRACADTGVPVLAIACIAATRRRSLPNSGVAH